MPSNRFSSTNQPSRRGGRKKKVFSYLIEKTKKDNCFLSKEQIVDIYTACISQTEETLKATINNKETLMIERIIAKEVLGKRGFDIIEKIVNRIVGMPKQATDITTNGKDLTPEPLTIEIIDKTEQIKQDDDL